jgi:hypothetical protein
VHPQLKLLEHNKIILTYITGKKNPEILKYPGSISRGKHYALVFFMLNNKKQLEENYCQV